MSAKDDLRSVDAVIDEAFAQRDSLFIQLRAATEQLSYLYEKRGGILDKLREEFYGSVRVEHPRDSELRQTQMTKYHVGGGK